MQLLCYCLNKVLDLLRFRSFKMNWFSTLGGTGLLSQSDTIRNNINFWLTCNALRGKCMMVSTITRNSFNFFRNSWWGSIIGFFYMILFIITGWQGYINVIFSIPLWIKSLSYTAILTLVSCVSICSTGAPSRCNALRDAPVSLSLCWPRWVYSILLDRIITIRSRYEFQRLY